mgnify:CR=1 FL=1
MTSSDDEAARDLTETVVDSRVVHRGGYLEVRVDRIRRADGSEADRDIVGHPGAVAILAIDEIQKVPEWSETVKRLWDEDTASSTLLKVVLLGSSPLLLQRGLG